MARKPNETELAEMQQMIIDAVLSKALREGKIVSYSCGHYFQVKGMSETFPPMCPVCEIGALMIPSTTLPGFPVVSEIPEPSVPGLAYDLGDQVGTVDSSGSGRKDDTGKPRYDLLPALALDELAQLFANGAQKYGDRNWENGMKFGRMFAAMMRHAWKWWRGEEDDPENKVHHLTSVAWYALCLLEYIRTGRGGDDRSTLYTGGTTK